jgi:hypothetical protein
MKVIPIRQLEQRATETVNDYFGRLDQIIDEMLSTFPPSSIKHQDTFEELRNHMQKFLFIAGLRERIRTEVLKVSPTTLVEALKEASKFELIFKWHTNRVSSNKVVEFDLDKEEIMAINRRRFRLGKPPLVRCKCNASDEKCFHCNKMGQTSKTCTAPRR